MHETRVGPVLPYTRIFGLDHVKESLELAFIEPRLGGARGTGKSLVARAFAQMLYGRLPVTLPHNATQDRVEGGWQVEALVRGEFEELPGLLEEAAGQLLFVDDINLLTEHIARLLLAAASTGMLPPPSSRGIVGGGRVLPARREEGSPFTLLGTACCEEGDIYPQQLLECFGLLVTVDTARDAALRTQILRAQLEWEAAGCAIGQAVAAEESSCREGLERAREALPGVRVDRPVADCCVRVADAFGADPQRGPLLLLLAARALAAREGQDHASAGHLRRMARSVLQHRRRGPFSLARPGWGEQEDLRLSALLGGAGGW